MNDKDIGSSFDVWLKDEGIHEQVTANAIKRATIRQEVAAIPDFGDEAVRRCLGPAALKIFSRMMEIWKVRGEEARLLLSLAPGTNIGELDLARLGEEQLMRISYLIGIYKALHVLHGDELADQWVRLPNTNAMFSGQAPLNYMIRGGIEALRNVRRLLDGRVQGC